MITYNFYKKYQLCSLNPELKADYKPLNVLATKPSAGKGIRENLDKSHQVNLILLLEQFYYIFDNNFQENMSILQLRMINF